MSRENVPPPVCVGCGEAIEDPEALCLGCHEKAAPDPAPVMLACRSMECPPFSITESVRNPRPGDVFVPHCPNCGLDGVMIYKKGE